MKLFPIIFTIFLFGNSAFCQNNFGPNQGDLEHPLSQSISQAFPASVRLFAYDTISRQQAGPQFSGVVTASDGYILTQIKNL